MVTDIRRDDIFKTDLGYIAFAVNAEGYNDQGFAGIVARNYTSAIAYPGTKQIGTIVQAECKKFNFYGLVCHSLRRGWHDAPGAIIESLDSIVLPRNYSVAVVLIGAGAGGKISDANHIANLRAIHDAKRSCVVYTLKHSKEELLRTSGIEI